MAGRPSPRRRRRLGRAEVAMGLFGLSLLYFLFLRHTLQGLADSRNAQVSQGMLSITSKWHAVPSWHADAKRVSPLSQAPAVTHRGNDAEQLGRDLDLGLQLPLTRSTTPRPGADARSAESTTRARRASPPAADLAAGQERETGRAGPEETKEGDASPPQLLVGRAQRASSRVSGTDAAAPSARTAMTPLAQARPTGFAELDSLDALTRPSGNAGAGGGDVTTGSTRPSDVRSANERPAGRAPALATIASSLRQSDMADADDYRDALGENLAAQQPERETTLGNEGIQDPQDNDDATEFSGARPQSLAPRDALSEDLVLESRDEAAEDEEEDMEREDPSEASDERLRIDLDDTEELLALRRSSISDALSEEDEEDDTVAARLDREALEEDDGTDAESLVGDADRTVEDELRASLRAGSDAQQNSEMALEGEQPIEKNEDPVELGDRSEGGQQVAEPESGTVDEEAEAAEAVDEATVDAEDEEEMEAAQAVSNFQLLLRHATQNRGEEEVAFVGDEDEVPFPTDDRVPCKTIGPKAECVQQSHCFWSSDSRCRTQRWAMSCSMTQVKKTCLKLKNCGWTSRTRTRGRFCEEREPEDAYDDEGDEDSGNDELESGNPEAAEKEEDEEQRVVCKVITERESCDGEETCYWSDDGSRCRTELWALPCAKTQLKSTCSKMKHCGWSSRSKTRGKYCKDRAPEEEGEADEEEGESTPRVMCKRITASSECEAEETCFWSDDGKGCKTELWAMTCSMTQLKSTCEQIPNCAWTAPTSKRIKGKFCVHSDDLEPIPSEPQSNAGSDAASSSSDPDPNQMRVRIGDQILTLWRCKRLKTEAHCDAFTHCEWGTTGCRTKQAFLPCAATALKSKCELLPHCVWGAAERTKGKLCFDKYFLDNPEELNTKCTRIKTVESCEAQIACEWRSPDKTKGKFCERQVSMAKAEEELTQVFPALEHGVFSLDSSEVKRIMFLEDEESRSVRIPCPKNLECQVAESLRQTFGLTRAELYAKSRYEQGRCCEQHAEWVKMISALSQHLREKSYDDWWIDREFLIGMIRFQGSMPPWTTTASVSIAAKSSKKVRNLMDLFNHGFKYRPYSVRACFVSSSSASTKVKITCKPLQKTSTRKRPRFYSLAHMDLEDGPELRIYPRIVPRNFKRCLFLGDERPVPLSLVTPTSECPFPMYGTSVRCPRFINAYLDIKYGQEWHHNPFVREQSTAPDWAVLDEAAFDPDGVTPASSLTDKFVWLRRHFCPTP